MSSNHLHKTDPSTTRRYDTSKNMDEIVLVYANDGLADGVGTGVRGEGSLTFSKNKELEM